MLSFLSTPSFISTLCHWLCFRARLKGHTVLVGTIIQFTEFRHTLSKRKIAGKATREPFLPLCDHRNGQYLPSSRIRLLVCDKQTGSTDVHLSCTCKECQKLQWRTESPPPPPPPPLLFQEANSYSLKKISSSSLGRIFFNKFDFV